MVRFRKHRIGLNGLFKLELGFYVTVLLCQKTAKIVPGFREVRPTAQRLTKLMLACRSVASLDGDGTQKIVRLRTLRIGLQSTVKYGRGLRDFSLPQIRVAKLAHRGGLRL